MACISITEGDVVHFPPELLRRPLVQTVNVGEQSVSGLSDIAVLGSSHLPSEVWPTKDGSDFARRFCLVLVITRLGSPIVDVVLEVSIADELLNLIFKHDALICSVADIFMRYQQYLL